jgi:hypothetical protein
MSRCDNSEGVIEREVDVWWRVMAHMYNFMLMPFRVQNYIIKALFSMKV